MSTKKRILVTLIVAVLAAIVIFPMLPLEYRDRVVAVLTHPLYYLASIVASRSPCAISLPINLTSCDRPASVGLIKRDSSRPSIFCFSVPCVMSLSLHVASMTVRASRTAARYAPTD